MDLQLHGARALVGGGSSGLGEAIAEALVSESASVAVAARNSERVARVSGRIGATGIPIDLSQPGGPAHAVACAVDALGGLDLLVVNSGGPPAGDLARLSDADWISAIDGTFLSAVRLINAAVPHLAASARPAVLVMLSSSTRMPIPGLTASNALRPGLAGLLKSLATELAPIRINGIAPGRVATDRVAAMDSLRAERAGDTVDEVRRQTIARIPLGRYGRVEDVATVAAFLLSPAAAYVTGAIVPVDGGLVTALP